MKPISLLFSLFALGAAPCGLASTINVPKDQPTIQAGINAANNGDTVLVSPGTYTENINFNGKAITVTSAMGSKVTIIDGGQANQVVTFDSGETQSSILRGFTIRNGNAICCGASAGGILISNSSPTISHNTITKNFGCGINAVDGAPVIEDNVISYTTNVPPSGYSYCGVAQGSGILLGNQSGQIIGNTIIYNVAGPDGNGGGIYLWVGGAPLIENNIIAFNQAGIYSSGGGITMQNSGAPIIVQNLIIGNKAGTVGGGLDLEIPNDGSTALMVNNTIAGNSTADENHGPIGADVYISGFYGTAAFWNNIITGATKNYLLYCDPTYGVPSPSFHNNDVFNSKGGDYVGTCAGQTGHKGNISADAKFVNPTKRNYELSAGSPAINAGTKSAPDLPKKDLAGRPRIVGGRIDIGAYEYQGTESDRK
jgi:Right handed beta helix region